MQASWGGSQGLGIGEVLEWGPAGHARPAECSSSLGLILQLGPALCK